MHGHLWCMKGVILPISESHYCQKPSIKFLIKRIYGLERDGSWRIPIYLFSACKKPSSSFCSRDHMVWKEMLKIPKWLFSAWPSLVFEWDDFLCFLSLRFAIRPSSRFWSREYMVWKEMVVEEFHCGCLIHGLLWCVNGMIFGAS